MGSQMVFKRYELKYLLTRGQQRQLKSLMAEHMIADKYGKSTILSLYYDTPDFLLARRSMEHPLYKEKLRLRSYGVAKADGEVFLEIKKKYDGIVYKRRISMKKADADRYLFGGEYIEDNQIFREIDFFIKRYQGIAPSILLSYEREAFYGREDSSLRITFDENILWRRENMDLEKEIGGRSILGEGMVLMEVKMATAMPLWLATALSERKIYKTSFSKYGQAYKGIAG